MTLHKDDIDILDRIIEIAVEKGHASNKNLPSLDKSDKSHLDKVKDIEYRPYFKIIEEFEVAHVSLTLDSAYVQPIELTTERFQKNGGFKEEYRKQQQQLGVEKLQTLKKINDARLSQWHKNTYWWTFGIAIAGFIMAFVSLILLFNRR